jgi:hypothetical protein
LKGGEVQLALVTRIGLCFSLLSYLAVKELFCDNHAREGLVVGKNEKLLGGLLKANVNKQFGSFWVLAELRAVLA